MLKLVSKISRRLFPPSETIEGYEHPELVDLVFQKTVAYHPLSDWAEMADVSTVLDFGGGCGRHFKQARSSTVRWAVVETAAMVNRARELETDKLRFFTSIEEAAAWLGPVEVMHSNGALQFSERPERTLNELCRLRARRMIWDRMYLSNDLTERQEIQVSNLIDNGPGEAPLATKNKAVKYPYVRIPEKSFLAAHEDRYKINERGPDWFRFVAL